MEVIMYIIFLLICLYCFSIISGFCFISGIIATGIFIAWALRIHGEYLKSIKNSLYSDGLPEEAFGILGGFIVAMPFIVFLDLQVRKFIGQYYKGPAG